MAQKGFKGIVSGLIRSNPGLTQREYAKMALDQGLSGSDSKDPVFSLASTLAKEFREGRMPGIKASGRPMRFYPDDDDATPPSPIRDKPLSILLPHDVSEIIDVLVEVGKFENRSEALVWLARAGITEKRGELDQVRQIVEQIRKLKQSVPV